MRPVEMAGIAWGISTLIQVGSILLLVISSFFRKDRALLRLMSVSFLLSALTGVVALFATFSEAQEVLLRLTLSHSLVTLLLLSHQLVPERFLRWSQGFLLLGGLTLVLLWVPGADWSLAAARCEVALVLIAWAVSTLVRPRPLMPSAVAESLLMVVMALLIAWRFLLWTPLPVFSAVMVSWCLSPVVARVVSSRGTLPSGMPPFLNELLRFSGRVSLGFTPLVMVDLLIPAEWHPLPEVLPSLLLFSFVLFLIPLRMSVRQLFDGATPPSVSLEELTIRQQEVAALLASGLSYSEIAGKLFISQETVKSHGKAIYRHFGISGRRELRQKLSSPPSQA